MLVGPNLQLKTLTVVERVRYTRRKLQLTPMQIRLVHTKDRYIFKGGPG